MAVPKKRTGHSAQGKRRANWKATKPETTICSNCGEPVLTHTVCTACGYYKGEPVRLQDKAAAVAVKETKKPVKKTAKKSTKKAEAKVEEAKAEEVKVEEKAEETAAEEVKEEEKDDKSVEE